MNTSERINIENLHSPYLTKETNLEHWIVKTEEFYRRRLKHTVDLRRMFAFPERLQWASAIPVYDPGTLDNNAAVRLLGKQLVETDLDFDVMRCKNSKATGTPTLHLIENSVEPTSWTRPPRGASPSHLLETEENFLGLRGWAIAYAVYNYVITHGIMDPTTLTYFPADALSNGKIPGGNGYSSQKHVRFTLSEPDEVYIYNGARVALSVPRRP
ncbi:MAG: hypothetical protein WCV79_01950 [Candidatus Paceibacterota bacterium]